MWTPPTAEPGRQTQLARKRSGITRNPAGHREVDYGEVAEAAEAVTAASLLMRILDRVEKRRT